MGVGMGRVGGRRPALRPGETSANLAVMRAWSDGKPIVGRHVSGRNPAPPVLSLAEASQRSSADGKRTKSFRLQSPLVAWLGAGLGLGLGLGLGFGLGAGLGFGWALGFVVGLG